MVDVIEFPKLISKAVVDHLQLAFGYGSGNSISLTSLSVGFCWIRATPEQLSRLASDEEIELAAVVALFPPAVTARIEVRGDVRLRLTHPAEASKGVSVVKVTGELRYLLTPLSEPCNAMDSLRLLVDIDDAENVFILVEFNESAHIARGWVPMQATRRWAAEANQRDGGDAPSFMYRIGKTIS